MEVNPKSTSGCMIVLPEICILLGSQSDSVNPLPVSSTTAMASQPENHPNSEFVAFSPESGGLPKRVLGDPVDDKDAKTSRPEFFEIHSGGKTPFRVLHRHSKVDRAGMGASWKLAGAEGTPPGSWQGRKGRHAGGRRAECSLGNRRRVRRRTAGA